MDELLLVLRVLLALGVVGGALWWLQRRARRARSREVERPVRVLARQGIAAKAQVVLLEADGRRLLLGVTEQQITVLHDAAVISESGVQPETSAATSVTSVTVTTSERSDVAPGAPAIDTRSNTGPGVESTPEPIDFETALTLARERRTGAEQSALRRPRDEHRRARTVRAARASAIEGSILAPETWRQAAAALRTGRVR